MELKTNYNIQELINYSNIGIIPEKEINFNNFSHKDWNIFWTEEKMMSSKNLDLIAPYLKVQRLPEMVYGFNRFVLINEKKDFMFEVNPFDMLDFSNFKEREAYYKTNENEEKENDSATERYKRIYYIPKELKVQYAEKWKTIKVDRDDIMKSEPTTDWSYSSPYMGTISNISSNKIFNKANPTNSITPNKNIKIETTSEQIPLHRLGRDNPVLKIFEVLLFDDELNDNGTSCGTLRFRIMNDCLFGLIRFYLRVDNVAVRIMDTRFFHSFDQNYLLREFSVRENSYSELINKGFKINSEWSLSHSQADMVYNSLDVIFCVRDKISF